MARSRLSTRLEKKTKRTLFFSILGSLLVLFLFVTYGLPTLVNVVSFISNMKASKESDNKKNRNVFLSAPILDSLPTGTNSAQLTISGSATEKQVISLYINERLIDKTTASKDNSFRFENVTLLNGENSIRTKATQDNEDSDFSEEHVVIYKNTPPSLSLDSPKEGQTFNKDDSQATIQGKTDPKVSVSINDLRAIVDIEGNFSYRFPLKNGENKITVKAIDEAGNKMEIERKITYNP